MTAPDDARPPLRLINFWRVLLEDGEVYRSPGRALLRESSDWDVPIQREYPLHESPFWYFHEGRERARGHVEAYDAEHPAAAEHAAEARARRYARYTRNILDGRRP